MSNKLRKLLSDYNSKYNTTTKIPSDLNNSEDGSLINELINACEEKNDVLALDIINKMDSNNDISYYNPIDASTLLMIIINNNSEDVGLNLLKKFQKKCRLEKRNREGNTALILATYKNYHDLSKLIVSFEDCNINCINKKGESALSNAIDNNMEDVVNDMIKANVICSQELFDKMINKKMVVAVGMLEKLFGLINEDNFQEILVTEYERGSYDDTISIIVHAAEENIKPFENFAKEIDVIKLIGYANNNDNNDNNIIVSYDNIIKSIFKMVCQCDNFSSALVIQMLDLIKQVDIIQLFEIIAYHARENIITHFIKKYEGKLVRIDINKLFGILVLSLIYNNKNYVARINIISCIKYFIDKYSDTLYVVESLKLLCKVRLSNLVSLFIEKIKPSSEKVKFIFFNRTAIGLTDENLKEFFDAHIGKIDDVDDFIIKWSEIGIHTNLQLEFIKKYHEKINDVSSVIHKLLSENCYAMVMCMVELVGQKIDSAGTLIINMLDRSYYLSESIIAVISHMIEYLDIKKEDITIIINKGIKNSDIILAIINKYGKSHVNPYELFSLACTKRKIDLADLIINKFGVDLFKNESFSPIILACTNKLEPIAIKLIDQFSMHCNPELVYNNNELTLLLCACITKMKKLAIKLIKTYGARCKPSFQNCYYKTALMVIAQQNQIDILRTMIDVYGTDFCDICNVNASNNFDGYTALEYSYSSGSYEIFMLLSSEIGIFDDRFMQCYKSVSMDTRVDILNRIKKKNINIEGYRENSKNIINSMLSLILEKEINDLSNILNRILDYADKTFVEDIFPFVSNELSNTLEKRFITEEKVKTAKLECVICRELLLEPCLIEDCGHICICNECSKQLGNNACPLCRKKITKFRRVYL